MPKPIDEDRARRRAELEKKRAARRAAIAQQQQKEKELQQQQQEERQSSSAASLPAGSPEDSSAKTSSLAASTSYLLEIPEVAVHVLFTYLSAADLGRLTMTCKSMNLLLPDARAHILLSRLNRHGEEKMVLGPTTKAGGVERFIDMCSYEAEANSLVEQSYGGGDTGRILPRGKFAKKGSNEFISYSRFVEEAVSGYGTLSAGRSRADPIMLPNYVEGRFCSVSPEHSLCRRGGDGQKSGGGSGVASWGVGKRGQLGHGKREDERHPRMLLGGIGYGIRIVQVSAGGGLVRVAHSLFLTSSGRVLSMGTGQYGALGHGFSAAKQLPDVMRPAYIESLNGVRCVCVSAGELHSACVTSDGDVYTWGDGFCGHLGHGDKRPQVSPKQVTLGGMEDECVMSICCGSRHTIAVSEEGEAFSWGLGHFGCLGRSFTPFDYDADTAVAQFAGLGNRQIADAGLPLAEEENRFVPAPPVQQQVAEPPGRDYAAELTAHLDLIANLSLDDSSDQCIPKLIDSLKEIKIVGASAGHRHSLLLDNNGSLYSCGSGNGLGHGDTIRQMHPVKITAFDEEKERILRMSAGVDMSMAVTTRGRVYSWGISDGGRLGLGENRGAVLLARRVLGCPVKAVDVECGYVHSLIVGLDGTLYECGGVGVDGEADGQQRDAETVPDFNIWHRVPEPKEYVKQERWKKFGKYEVKGRSKMMEEM